MNYGTVLHVYLVSHTDGIHITADYGVEPNRAPVAHDHITNHRSIFS
jgi:hypothetical protein